MSTIEVLKYGYNELDDLDSRKEGRVQTMGDIHVALSDGNGSLTAGTASVTISDLNGRPIVKRQTIAGAGYFYGDQIEIFCKSDLGRRAGSAAHRLGRVLLDTDSYQGEDATATMNGTDPFFAFNTSVFGPDKKFPTWLYPRIYLNAPEDVFSKYMPVILGEVSDEGAIDPQTGLANPRGKCPFTFVGIDPLGTGPGGTPENWGRFNVSLFAIWKIISLFGVDLSTTINGIANATSDGANQSTITFAGAAIDLSSVAAALAALSPTNPTGSQNPLLTLTLFTGLHGLKVSATIIAVGSNSVQVSAKIPAGDTYGFNTLAGIATGVDWIIGQWADARVRIDIALHQGVDIMIPGYAGYIRPTPYEDITATNEDYRVTDCWIRGPLLQAHLNGGPTFAGNCIGVEDKGDGSGLPFTDYFTAEYWWWINCVIINSQHPMGPGRLWPQTDGDIAGIGGAWSDGTYKINGISFQNAQTWSRSIITGGTKINAYFDEPTGMRDVAQAFNDNMGGPICRTGVSEHGQIFKWFLDTNAATTTWTPIARAERVFGKTNRWNAKPEIENFTHGPCDWDPDGGVFRQGEVKITSTLGVRNSKGITLPSKTINGKFVSSITQWTATLQARNNFTANGPYYVTLENCDPGLWDYHLGSGILYTDEVLSLVAEPMYIISKTFKLNSQSVDIVCLDIGPGPVIPGVVRTAPPGVGLVITLPAPSPGAGVTGGQIGLTGNAPTVVFSAKTLALSSGSVSLTGRAPSVAISNLLTTTGCTTACYTVTFTDAQIKAWPTQGLVLVPAPGVNKLLWPSRMFMAFKQGATAYTNIDPDAYMSAVVETGSVTSSYLGNDASLGIIDLASFFGSTGGVGWMFTFPYQDDRGAPDGWGVMSYLTGTNAITNKPLVMYMVNGALGNLTGGNAGNQIVITTEFTILDIP